jgi:mannose-6-phosphate isomerase class I
MSVLFRKTTITYPSPQAGGVEAPFQQWGLDFIGEFKENSSNGYRWVLTATDYFTRWVEAIPTKRATEEVVMNFLEERIITRFGVLLRLLLITPNISVQWH